MKRRLFIIAAITVLTMLWCSCGKGELDITLRTPEGPDEPTQPSDLRIGNMTEPIAFEARPTFTWKPAEDRSETGIKGYWVSIDSTEDWTWVEGVTHWKSPTNLADGPHIFRVKAEDHAGHVGSYASLSFEVEVGRPVLVITNLECVPDSPQVGGTLVISVRFKNQATAPVHVTLEFYLDDITGPPLQQQDIGELQAGGEVNRVSRFIELDESYEGRHDIIVVVHGTMAYVTEPIGDEETISVVIAAQ